jgi:hypothetical protein
MSKYNHEGYLDLTAYEAMSEISRDERQKSGKTPEPPKVYICSPFRGSVESNVKNALWYCRFALEQGKFPIAPHCYFPQFMDDNNPTERELALSFGLRLLYECRELWIFGNVITDGMKREIFAAKWRNIKIKRFDESMEEIFQ